MVQGLVFNVQRYSIHDGPGIRTTLFLKGCPLHCLWCHNPEAMSGKFEFGFFPERCIGCLECTKVCVNGVHTVDADGHRQIRRELCQGCGKCTDICYAEALERLGYWLTVDEAIARVERDRPFYETSKGGVTISGGEPLRQPEFTTEFLAGCQARGLHTALDTCGYAPWPVLEAAAAHSDMVLYDLKHMDSAAHRELTGVPNELILDNLSRLFALKDHGDVVIRMPFVPGYNDQDENVEATARFLAKFLGQARDGTIRVDVLPYHQLGLSKYRKLGKTYALESVKPPEPARSQHAAEILQGYGLSPKVG